MNTRECAEEIWSKLEELEVVDNDGLDPRKENAINEIEKLVEEAIEYCLGNMDID